jgi:hypothetical protein
MAGPQKTTTTNTTPDTKAPKKYPVKLLKNYRPTGKDFKVLVETTDDEGFKEMVPRDPEGTMEKTENGKIVVVATMDYSKVNKGASLLLNKTEAQHVLKNKIAERSDDLFDG